MRTSSAAAKEVADFLDVHQEETLKSTLPDLSADQPSASTMKRKRVDTTSSSGVVVSVGTAPAVPLAIHFQQATLLRIL